MYHFGIGNSLLNVICALRSNCLLLIPYDNQELSYIYIFSSPCNNCSQAADEKMEPFPIEVMQIAQGHTASLAKVGFEHNCI